MDWLPAEAERVVVDTVEKNLDFPITRRYAAEFLIDIEYLGSLEELPKFTKNNFVEWLRNRK